MSKKRVAQAENVVAPKLCVEPHNMIVLRATHGELFLVDRNCALVSRRCREQIMKMEGLLAQGHAILLSSKGDDSVDGPTSQLLHAQQSDSNNNNRDEQQRESVLHGTRLSYYAVHSDRSGTRPREEVRWLTVEQVLRSRHDESPPPEDPSSNSARASVSSGHALRRSGNGPASRGQPGSVPGTSNGVTGGPVAAATLTTTTTTTAATTPAAATTTMANAPNTGAAVSGANALYSCLETADDGLLYPLIDLPDVSAELLERGLAFMYFKYRADSEPEKRLTFPLQGSDVVGNIRLIAVCSLLDM